MEAGEIKEATEANEKLDNDLVKAFTLISTLCQKLISVDQENKTVAQEKDQMKEEAGDAHSKLQMELTAAYALILKLQKEKTANRNAVAKQAAETRASLLQNSETIAQLRGKVEGLVATYLEAAKKNALDVEDHRQTQQKIIDNLQKDKNADKMKMKEEKLKKHQEESKKKTERLEKDLGKMKRKRARSLLFRRQSKTAMNNSRTILINKIEFIYTFSILLMFSLNFSSNFAL